MTRLSAGEIAIREWHEQWINEAIVAYYKLHPKPRLAKKPELGASTLRSQKVFLRNSKGELIAIRHTLTGYFWKITDEKFKKHSIKIKQLGYKPKS